MDYLTKKYKEKCKELFDGYNFRIYNNNFYRVINDVFQSFNLHKSVSGCDCTVEFGVVMLCEGNGVYKSRCQPYRIKQFDNRDYSWFL